MLMTWKSIPCHNCCASKSSATHHGNRQDAREGGETPPLPRNCERPCFRSPSLSGCQGRDPARVFRIRGEPFEPLRTILGVRCGKVAGNSASQETGPRAPNPLAFRGERRSHHAVSSLTRTPRASALFHADCSAPHVIVLLLLVCCGRSSARPHPSAAWSRTPPAPRWRAPTSS